MKNDSYSFCSTLLSASSSSFITSVITHHPSVIKIEIFPKKEKNTKEFLKIHNNYCDDDVDVAHSTQALRRHQALTTEVIAVIKALGRNHAGI